MKRYFLLVLFFASCSTPSTAPQNTVPNIPNLTVADTLDFGAVPMGTMKDTVIQLENAGPDTLNISQSVSKSNFVIISNSNVRIAPGQKMAVTFRFTSADTLSQVAFDTIRAGKGQRIVVLQGFWSFFSTMFPLGPRSISVSLSGLIGNIHLLPPTSDRYSFDFSVSNGLTHWEDTLMFQQDVTSNGSYNDDHSTEIRVQLDTITHSIHWINAYSYENAYNKIGQAHGSFEKVENIIAHDIPLSKNAQGWYGELTGAGLSAFIDGAEYYADHSGMNPPQMEEANLTTILGYDSTAKLSILIY